jgi:hypothetical protein
VAYAAVDRPAWHEVVGIVLACAVVLVLLVRFDRAAYEAQMDRARKAIAAQQAERSPGAAERARAAVPPRQGAPRTESLGDRGPIVIGIGGAWSAGTAATVPDVTGSGPAPVQQRGVLRRITGPVVAADVPSTSDAAQTTARPPADPATAASPAKPSRPSTDLLVVLLAGVGTVMMAVGGVLVGLGRR